MAPARLHSRPARLAITAFVRQRPECRQIVHVVAERFSFTPSDITVDQGTAMELRITSDDTTHGFKVVGPKGTSDINVEVPKRGRGDVRGHLRRQRARYYVFECSHVCGAGHGFMRGTIRVKARSTS